MSEERKPFAQRVDGEGHIEKLELSRDEIQTEIERSFDQGSTSMALFRMPDGTYRAHFLEGPSPALIEALEYSIKALQRLLA